MDGLSLSCLGEHDMLRINTCQVITSRKSQQNSCNPVLFILFKVLVVGMNALLETDNIDELKKTLQVRFSHMQHLRLVLAITKCVLLLTAVYAVM